MKSFLRPAPLILVLWTHQLLRTSAFVTPPNNNNNNNQETPLNSIGNSFLERVDTLIDRGEGSSVPGRRPTFTQPQQVVQSLPYQQRRPVAAARRLQPQQRSTTTQQQQRSPYNYQQAVQNYRQRPPPAYRTPDAVRKQQQQEAPPAKDSKRSRIFDLTPEELVQASRALIAEQQKKIPPPAVEDSTTTSSQQKDTTAPAVAPSFQPKDQFQYASKTVPRTSTSQQQQQQSSLIASKRITPKRPSSLSNLQPKKKRYKVKTMAVKAKTSSEETKSTPIASSRTAVVQETPTTTSPPTPRDNRVEELIKAAANAKDRNFDVVPTREVPAKLADKPQSEELSKDSKPAVGAKSNMQSKIVEEANAQANVTALESPKEQVRVETPKEVPLPTNLSQQPKTSRDNRVEELIKAAANNSTVTTKESRDNRVEELIKAAAANTKEYDAVQPSAAITPKPNDVKVKAARSVIDQLTAKSSTVAPMKRSELENTKGDSSSRDNRVEELIKAAANSKDRNFDASPASVVQNTASLKVDRTTNPKASLLKDIEKPVDASIKKTISLEARLKNLDKVASGGNSKKEKKGPQKVLWQAGNGFGKKPTKKVDAPQDSATTSKLGSNSEKFPNANAPIPKAQVVREEQKESPQQASATVGDTTGTNTETNTRRTPSIDSLHKATKKVIDIETVETVISRNVNDDYYDDIRMRSPGFVRNLSKNSKATDVPMDVEFVKSSVTDDSKVEPIAKPTAVDSIIDAVPVSVDQAPKSSGEESKTVFAESSGANQTSKDSVSLNSKESTPSLSRKTGDEPIQIDLESKKAEDSIPLKPASKTPSTVVPREESVEPIKIAVDSKKKSKDSVSLKSKESAPSLSRETGDEPMKIDLESKTAQDCIPLKSASKTSSTVLPRKETVEPIKIAVDSKKKSETSVSPNSKESAPSLSRETGDESIQIDLDSKTAADSVPMKAFSKKSRTVLPREETVEPNKSALDSKKKSEASVLSTVSSKQLTPREETEKSTKNAVDSKKKSEDPVRPKVSLEKTDSASPGKKTIELNKLAGDSIVSKKNAKDSVLPKISSKKAGAAPRKELADPIKKVVDSVVLKKDSKDSELLDAPSNKLDPISPRDETSKPNSNAVNSTVSNEDVKQSALSTNSVKKPSPTLPRTEVMSKKVNSSLLRDEIDKTPVNSIGSSKKKSTDSDFGKDSPTSVTREEASGLQVGVNLTDREVESTGQTPATMMSQNNSTRARGGQIKSTSPKMPVSSSEDVASASDLNGPLDSKRSKTAGSATAFASRKAVPRSFNAFFADETDSKPKEKSTVENVNVPTFDAKDLKEKMKSSGVKVSEFASRFQESEMVRLAQFEAKRKQVMLRKERRFQADAALFSFEAKKDVSPRTLQGVALMTAVFSTFVGNAPITTATAIPVTSFLGLCRGGTGNVTRALGDIAMDCVETVNTMFDEQQDNIVEALVLTGQAAITAVTSGIKIYQQTREELSRINKSQRAEGKDGAKSISRPSRKQEYKQEISRASKIPERISSVAYPPKTMATTSRLEVEQVVAAVGTIERNTSSEKKMENVDENPFKLLSESKAEVNARALLAARLELERMKRNP